MRESNSKKRSGCFGKSARIFSGICLLFWLVSLPIGCYKHRKKNESLKEFGVIAFGEYMGVEEGFFFDFNKYSYCHEDGREIVFYEFMNKPDRIKVGDVVVVVVLYSTKDDDYSSARFIENFK